MKKKKLQPEEPAKIIILIEEGIVQSVSVPTGMKAEYMVIDRDMDAAVELHGTEWREAYSHFDLADCEPEAFEIAFGEETR